MTNDDRHRLARAPLPDIRVYPGKTWGGGGRSNLPGNGIIGRDNRDPLVSDNVSKEDSRESSRSHRSVDGD